MSTDSCKYWYMVDWLFFKLILKLKNNEDADR